MSTIKLNGQTYRVGKLNPMLQFHVSRRLAPAIAAVGLSIAQLQDLKNAPLGELLGPIADVAASMPEADADYIIFNCLAVCEREQGQRYAKILASGNRLLFEDIDMPTMLRLVAEVVKENLGGFFSLLPGATSSGQSSPTPDGQT